MKTKRIWSESELLALKNKAEFDASVDRQARADAYELAGARASEILKLRARVKNLEDAIRVAIDFGDGHAWWDSEGNPKIESGGYNLLKKTLEEA
jgi:hypothetical protein